MRCKTLYNFKNVIWINFKQNTEERLNKTPQKETDKSMDNHNRKELSNYFSFKSTHHYPFFNKIKDLRNLSLMKIKFKK